MTETGAPPHGYHPRAARRHARHASRRHRDRLRLTDATAMAIGGMIGGGIFSVLGTAIDRAGHLAFACFVIGGALAMLTARSYAALSVRAARSGGPFEYLRLAGHPEAAALTAWLLVLGYVLAMGVYGFTFGHYVADLLGAPLWVSQLATVVIVAAFLAVNLGGLTMSALSEDVIVAAKLVVLVGIAAIGLAHSHVDRLRPLADRGWGGLMLGAPAIFVAFEGFELLTFDHDDLEDPARTLPRAMYLSILVVGVVYVTVTLGSQMLLSDSRIIGDKEVAFAAVGQQALGGVGRVAAALGAALATSSAIHATLFATARFARDLGHAGELPRWFARVRRGVPANALLALSVAGVLCAMVPSLDVVLAFASCTFLAVFLLVDVLSARLAPRGSRLRLIGIAGAVGCAMAIVLLLVDLATTAPASLAVVAGLVIVVVAGRIAQRAHRRRHPPGPPTAAPPDVATPVA